MVEAREAIILSTPYALYSDQPDVMLYPHPSDNGIGTKQKTLNTKQKTLNTKKP